MPTKVSKFIDPEADRQQPPSMEGCGMSDSREAFAFCFTDVNGKPSEFCDHPKHAAEGDTRIRTPLYTHPASAAPDEEYLRALQDAFDINQAPV